MLIPQNELDDDPEICARQVLDSFFCGEEPSFPIDPFGIINSFGVVYQVANFKVLEGYYLPALDENDIHLIAIKNNNRITRQRFTAGHELWHFLKNSSKAGRIQRNDTENEKAANKFSAELLAPSPKMASIAKDYAGSDGYVSFESALEIAEYFGISFQACAYSLLDLGFLEDKADTRNEIKGYNADGKRIELGKPIDDPLLVCQMLDSYQFYLSDPELVVWLKYKNNLLFYENRIEKLGLDIEKVSEIVTDLRMNGQQSRYCTEKHDICCEIAGHSKMYDYIIDKNGMPSIYDIFDMHKGLYQFCPFPECGGHTRTEDVHTRSQVGELGSTCETVSYGMIWPELRKLNEMVEMLVDNAEDISYSEYIQSLAKVHHRLTQIHPFSDGNGRCARGFHNMLMKHKKLPPIYIDIKSSEEYFRCLGKADLENDTEDLSVFFMRQVLSADARLHESLLATGVFNE